MAGALMQAERCAHACLKPPNILRTHPCLACLPAFVAVFSPAQVGGLGDVVTSLGRAVQDQGHMVEVILPWYQFFGASPLLGGRQFEAEFDWGGAHIVVTSCVVEGLRVFFIDPHNGFFNTSSVYGRCGLGSAAPVCCAHGTSRCRQQGLPAAGACAWGEAAVLPCRWRRARPPAPCPLLSPQE